VASAAEPAASGIRLQYKQLTDCLTGCEHRRLTSGSSDFFLFFNERKGEAGAERFSILSGYSDLASDVVVDFRVQKDYK